MFSLHRLKLELDLFGQERLVYFRNIFYFEYLLCTIRTGFIFILIIGHEYVRQSEDLQLFSLVRS